PPGVVTAMGPLAAPVGTLARSCVELSTVNVPAATPPNVTPVVPVKAVPVTVTWVPTVPLVGVNEVMVGGGGSTVKLDALVPVPSGVVTPIGPVAAVVGTSALSWVSLSTVNVPAATPPNVTLVAPVSAAPVTVTWIPTTLLVGVN